MHQPPALVSDAAERQTHAELLSALFTSQVTQSPSMSPRKHLWFLQQDYHSPDDSIKALKACGCVGRTRTCTTQTTYDKLSYCSASWALW